MKSISKKDKIAFEGDDKYQKQKEVVPFGFGERAWQTYEPFKRGSEDSQETQMVLYWDTVKDLFFDKGNRWSGVVKQLKQMYSEITPDQITDLMSKVQYYLGQYKQQVESAKTKTLSLNDAIKYFMSVGKAPVRLDAAEKMVEWQDGSKTSYDDTVKMALEQMTKESNFGLMDGPKDIGKNPSGDWPSVQWMPKGEEDLDVSPNVTTAEVKIQNEQEKITTANDTKTSKSILRNLSKDLDNYVRTLVAKNPNTPIEVLADLISDPEETVRDAVNLNPLKREQLYTQVKELKLRALEIPLTDDEQTQIAGKYGPEYNSALAHLYFAAKRGHSLDKAIEYAITEMKKVNVDLDPKKLVEALNQYLRFKL